MSERLDDAKRYWGLAGEMRLLAIQSRSAQHRESLLKLADEYERMAREAEALEATREILQQVAPR